MRTRALGLSMAAWALCCAGIVRGEDPAPPARDATKLIGTWKLVRYEDRPVDGGAPVFPLGEHPRGQLIYDANGNMSVQFMKMPHPQIASGDEDKVTPAEKQALYDGYVAYFGRYRVDDTKHVVIHEVEGDLADVFIGHAEERPYVLDGDTLKLVPEWESLGKKWRGVREFVRAK